MSTWVKRIGAVVFLASIMLVLWGKLADEPRPQGKKGPQAELLADKILNAVNVVAWKATPAIRWRMAPSRPLFLWDRVRGWVQSEAGEGTEHTVIRFRTDRTQAEVMVGGQRVEGEAAKVRVDRAWADFINDSFWLNAPATIRDRGTSRAIVKTSEGRDALLVTYHSGGVTPGDAYLWLVDDQGRPTAWKMWVGALPVGGLEVSWSEWVTLKTGALVARQHEWIAGLAMRHEPLQVGESAADLNGGTDPFEALLDPVHPQGGAASQPSMAPMAADALPPP